MKDAHIKLPQRLYKSNRSECRNTCAIPEISFINVIKYFEDISMFGAKLGAIEQLKKNIM